ncbi:DUF1289 domain-containing protein [Xinfangfangia pollutisoli]|uniref:DUF1289 domain-containing protein n=1 Tax=Xinfangfangia pollutisoli TaxID=2865960 RepID=UPI001CD759C1|nr:DUF1289 domain-containing protein [Xinfangfangia pollutisoli]
MKDEVWKRDEVQSPCVKLCLIHPEARICVGCHRTIDEISAWSRLSPEARIAIMTELPGRKGQLAQRRGGRQARLERPEG